MPSSISAPSSPDCFDTISETFAPVKKFFENPKVKKVAIEILKGLACIAFGVAMGALSFTPLGAGMLAIGIGVGAGFGAFSYIGITTVQYIIKKYGFPSNRYCVAPPTSIEEWLSDDNYKKFEKVFTKKIAVLGVLYETWKTAQNIDTKDAAKAYFWKEFQKGLCQSVAQTLIPLLKEHSALDGKELLREMKSKDIFHRQMLEIMRRDLTDPAIDTLTFEIPGTKPLPHLELKKNDLEHDPRLLINSLKTYLNQKNPYQALAMTIRLQREAPPAHTIYAELHPNWRFYDPSSILYSGMHEGFKSQDKFLISLQKHLLGFNSAARPGISFDEIIIRCYLVDRPEVQKQAETAKAGTAPKTLTT